MTTLYAHRGTSFEKVVEDSAHPLVTLDKTKAGMKILSGGKIIRQAGPPDYIGTVNGTGRLLLFDAKECGEGRFPLANMPAMQRRWLVRHGRAGAIAGLLIHATALKEYRWLPWQGVEVLRPSVAWDETCLVGEANGRVDFGRIIQ